MSLRGSMFISFFLALMIPGVGAGQEAAVRSLGDICVRQGVGGRGLGRVRRLSGGDVGGCPRRRHAERRPA